MMMCLPAMVLSGDAVAQTGFENRTVMMVIAAAFQRIVSGPVAGSHQRLPALSSDNVLLCGKDFLPVRQSHKRDAEEEPQVR